ncbi:MAG TPA: DUF2244 domain-containing protein, partial [Usitatibacter sp.]
MLQSRYARNGPQTGARSTALSLGGVGFLVLMGVICAVSFVGGVVFYLIGAWPVGGFFGLDAVLIYWAFRVNYRDAAAYEEVTVT